jgi:hypothetical protein
MVPLETYFLHLGYVVVGYTSERHGRTLHELITFSLSRTTVEVSLVAAGEHMVPGPFQFLNKQDNFTIRHMFDPHSSKNFCRGSKKIQGIYVKL